MGFEDWSNNKKKKKSSSFEEWSNATRGISKKQEEEDEKKRQAYLAQRKSSDDDIAPVGGNKDSWFKSGGFSDGVDGVGDFLGDLGQTVGGTVGDLGLGILKGAGRLVEGVVDLGTYGVAGVADLLGKDDFAQKTKDVAQYSFVDDFAPIRKATDFVDRYSVLGDKADMVSEGLGQVGAIILTGGLGVAGGLGAGGTAALTTGVVGLSGVGSGMNAAYQSGASDKDAFVYGLGTGAIEAGTELLFGGLGKGVKALGISRGIGGLDDIFAKKLSSSITRAITNESVQRVAGNTIEAAVKAGGEGAEEVLSGLGSAVMKWMTYEDDETLGKLIEDERLLDQFVVGAITSSIAQGADFVKANASGRDFVTGYTNSEQAVIDKEVEKRVSEREKAGRKLTTREISAIEEQVRSDMEHGQLDIDTIEEVLGGESYTAYRDTVKSEDDLKAEYEQLASIKKSELTTAQEDRLAELKSMNLGDTTKRDGLRQKLDEAVRPQLRDSKLAETYRERERRGQAFEADLSKYTGKQREAVERAVKSGVLNNTYRSHELVDMLSKIEAAKGISFDYTNNAKLKESGFAVDGYTVNGYANKKTGSVTLNVQSAKAWQSVVGHEITHVLEGTEAYGELRNALYEYAERAGVLEARRAELTALYQDMADIDEELTADLVGDYLFTDKKFIDHLVGNRNLFQKVYDEIKYLCKVATGKELTAIEKVKHEFDRAWKELSAGGVKANADEFEFVSEPDAKEHGDDGVQYSISTDGLSDSDKESANVVLSALKTNSMSSKYLDGYATYTAERMDREIKQSSASGSPDYAKSYITWVDPIDFIYATTISDKNRTNLKEEAGSLDIERLKNETQPIHLTVNFETGEIVGHEGRHRMLALKDAGIDKVAVIIDALNDDRLHTKPVDFMSIKGQNFGGYTKGTDMFLHNLLPLSERYADAAKALFTNKPKSGIQYSLSENGESKTLYSGSPNTNIQQFKVGGVDGSRQTGDRYGRGVYLTTNRNTAKGYAGDSGKVYEINADGLNIFNLNDSITDEMKATLQRELNGKDKQFRNSVLRNFRSEKAFTDFESAERFFDAQRKLWKEEDGYYAANKPDIKSANDKTGEAVIEYTDFANIENAIGNLTGNELYDALKSISTDDFASFITGHGFDGISIDEDADNQQYVIYRNEDRLRIMNPGSEDVQYSVSDKNIKDVSIDYAYGETYYTMSYEQDGKVVGTLEYGEYEGQPNVKMIEVLPEYRRKGIGKKLLQELQRKYPEQEIDFGMSTPDGTKLLESITYEVTDDAVVADMKKLKDLQSELDYLQGKLDVLYDTENLTEAQEAEMYKLGDRWQEVYETIYALESELKGKKASRTFVKTDEGVQFSLSAESDAEYMSAVERGDTETAQKMVDDAASISMPKSKIRDKSGQLIPVYHGTRDMFYKFDTSVKGGVNGTAEGYGIYTSDDPEVTAAYGDRQIKMYANITKPATSTKKSITKTSLVKLIKDTCQRQAKQMVADGEYDNVREAIFDTWVSNYTYTYGSGMDAAYRETAEEILRMNDNDMDIVREIMSGMAIRDYEEAYNFYHNSLTPITGIDGFVTEWENASTGKKSNIILALDSNQLKSADAVTYDDDGNVIPISERFNEKSDDIRRSLSKEGDEGTSFGNYRTPFRELALEDAAPVVGNTPTAKEDTPTASGNTPTVQANTPTVSTGVMYSDDYAPVTEEEADALSKARYDTVTDADAPPEMPEPYYGEPIEPVDPFESRDMKAVGSRSVKAYMYENPEVKPFFQQEAEVMLGDLYRTQKAERGFNDQLYYESGGEAGIWGVQRNTAPDIAELKDKFGYTYDQIEAGIKAIIEDNGKENNACSKRIEFMLNDRLLNGYRDFDGGFDIPANQKYINLVNEKGITEYNEAARKNYFEYVEEYIPPVEDDIAPVEVMEETPSPDAIAPMTVDEANAIQDAKARADAAAEGFPKSRKQLHMNIMNDVKATFSSLGYDFDGVLAKAKNLSTFATVDNTPQRVMEKALGYKAGGVLADLTVNKVAQNESAGIRWLNSFTDRKNGLIAKISKQYRIKPGSKESAAAQMYAEGFYVDEYNDIIKYGDEELALDFPNLGVQERIKGLAHDPRIRRIYDETLDAINASRVRNAYPEIQKLDNYFLHFRAMDDTFSKLGLPFNPNDIRAKDLPTDLNGVTADLKPGQPYFASAMHRTGKRTSFDLLGGLERYLTSAKNQIYHIDDIQTLRALRNYMADTYGQANGLEGIDMLTEEEVQERIDMVYNSHLSTFAKFLNEEANMLAGKTALIDRGLEGIIGRRGMTFLDTVNRQVGSNMVGFNISSSLTNFLPVAQTFAKTNKFDFTKAFAQTVSNKISSIFGKGDGFAENSPVIIRRKGADRFYRTPWQKAGDAGYVLMSAVDDISTELIARTKYNELTRKGMDEQTAHFETDKWVSRLMGDRSLGQQPQLYNSKTLGIFTKFQLEVRNQLDSQFYDTIQEAKVSAEDIQNGLARNAKIAAKVTSTFVQLAVVQHLYGTAFESVAGYNPAFDIISTLATMFGFDDEEDSEDTVLDNIEQGFLDLLEDLPYTSTFTGGRIPISSALPIKEVITGVDEYGNDKSRLETLGEAAPYYVLPGGYGQVKKTAQGLGMFSDEHPVAGSYTDSGNLRFPVEDTPANRVQAAIFGQYASRNAREYFDREYAPLNEKQIQEYVDVDMPIGEYREYREGLKGLTKTEEKLDYIAGLDLPVSKKNILANNVTDRKEPIDLTNYEDFGSLAEFDFANNNPEKYAFAKSVGGYASYKTYTKALGDFHADKDANGKEIKDSRKRKVLDYINNLDADYGAKIILYKSQYPGDDSYNADIIEYLNGRGDLTYEERVSILTELGFRVTADGQIYAD